MHCYLCELEFGLQNSTYYTLPTDDSYALYKIVKEYHFCKPCSIVLEGLLDITKELRALAKE